MRIGKTGKVELQATYIKMVTEILKQRRQQAWQGSLTIKVSFGTNREELARGQWQCQNRMRKGCGCSRQVQEKRRAKGRQQSAPHQGQLPGTREDIDQTEETKRNQRGAEE